MDNLDKQKRLDEALALSASLCVRTGTLRHLPDEIDISTDSFSGHYSQAFSHIGVIARVNLARLLKQSR